MIIELGSGLMFENSKISYIEKILGVWKVRLSTGEIITITNSEYSWLMTIHGNLVEITSTLAFNLDAITTLTPNDDGYLIGWAQTLPFQITKVKGDALKIFLNQKPWYFMNLEERKQKLIGYGVSESYKKLA